jgi:hypothetical protein
MYRGYLLFDTFHFIWGTDYGRLEATARQKTKNGNKDNGGNHRKDILWYKGICLSR